MEQYTKEFFIEKIKNETEKPFKMRFIKNGKYGEPECWIYPLDFKQQKGKLIFNGELHKFTTSGLLITLETLLNKQYLKEYLQSCF